MGGEITVDARPEGGSRFCFQVMLPVVPEQHAVVPVRLGVAGYAGPRQRLLVVDDQAENRELLRQMLEPLGFEVTLAADGREAIATARAHTPALILMDLRMPDMDGFDAAAAIRELPGLESVPVLAASASSADLARARADSTRFQVCLRKPFQIEELLDILQGLLNLEWRYDSEPTHQTEEARAAVPMPAAEVVEELLDLARLGKLVRIEQLALELERREPALAPFARRVHALARAFDEERLIALLESGMAGQRDAVAGH
jgi:CheY-like chemotaxis protein